MYLKLNQHDRALEMFSSSLSLARDNKFLRSQVDAHTRLSGTYAALHQWADARTHHARALQLVREIGDETLIDALLTLASTIPAASR